MRIAYVVGWPGGSATGPFKKVRAQTDHWAAAGDTVGIFVLTTPEHEAEWRAVPGVRRVEVRTSGPALVWRKERLLHAALSWAPDVLYHRWALAYPGLWRAAGQLPVVLEVNTDDIAEYDLLAPLKGRVNRLTRGAILRRAAGLVATTHELAASTSFAPYGRQTAVVTNGVDLSRSPEFRAPANDRPVLVFIGQPWCPWHGVDKVAELARHRPGWDFHVVGPDRGEIPALPNLQVHGLLEHERYLDVLATADVGIGSLALHRKGMDEAAPLKVREYLAGGIPAIVGYRDSDFPEGADYLLRLPNSDDNIVPHLERLDAFVDSWRGRRVPRGSIAHLDEVAKERQRRGFFEQVVASWPMSAAAEHS